MEFGVSVYLGFEEYPLEKTIEYLKEASRLGYSMVFSSLHIGEAKSTIEEFYKLCDVCQKLNLKLNVDICKRVYDELKPLKVERLRLDYGFSNAEIAQMSKSKDFLIELNASTVSEKELKELVDAGINPNQTSFSFNFYPKLYSGHDEDFVKNQTALIHKYGFSVYGFIPSHVMFRAPMYEGLPTVENHRHLDLDVAVEELKYFGLDGIYFGDAYASGSELSNVIEHNDENICLPLELYDNKYDYLYDEIAKIRRDVNPYILRFTSQNSSQSVDPANQQARSLGDLTIDNCLMKRYMGEFNICECDLPNDSRVNTIGKVLLTKRLLEFIKDKKRIKFLRRPKC